MSNALGKVDRQIIDLIRSHKKLASAHIEQLTGLTHQTVSGNLRHLVERGFVRNSGHKGITYSGRRAILWEIVP